MTGLADSTYAYNIGDRVWVDTTGTPSATKVKQWTSLLISVQCLLLGKSLHREMLSRNVDIFLVVAFCCCRRFDFNARVPDLKKVTSARISFHKNWL
jgi:hypothetical protein